jgi:adenylate cyclase
VVAALPGLSADIDDHTVMVAQFCADVLDLCQSINGQAINVKIGINCGRVTAGVIGRTRQFYRLFGDTMNGERGGVGGGGG